jgi:hypothetical protein
MAYTSTFDERYIGSYVSYSAGYYDAPSSLNSLYTIKQGGSAYGTLTYNNYIPDQDIYSLGIINAGYYKVDVNDMTWDWANYDYGSIASFSVLNSAGAVVGTSYSSYTDITFTVNFADTYYVKLTGPYFSSAQYVLYYTKIGELNSPAIWSLTTTRTGELSPGSVVSVSTPYYFDSNGNSDNIVSTWWYLDGVQSNAISSSQFVPHQTDQGKNLSVQFSFYDDLGNFEISDFYLVGTVASDTTAPTVTSFSPADGATGVAASSNIVLTFSEAIARGTGNIVLRSGSATGTAVETFDAATSTRLAISGSTLTIDPTSNLAGNTQYFVTFASGSIRDLANNNYAGTTTYDFRTVASDTTGTSVNYTENRSDGNFLWNVKYDLHYDEIKFLVTTRIDLAGDMVPIYLVNTWEHGIESMWNKFFFKSDAGRVMPVVFDVQFVDDGNSEHYDVRFINGSGRTDMLTWYFDSGWGQNYHDEIAAHEYGHMIGMFDEYSGGATYNNFVTTGTLMSDLTHHLPTNYLFGVEYFAEILSGLNLSTFASAPAPIGSTAPSNVWPEIPEFTLIALPSEEKLNLPIMILN